jgi:hypothetical protein
LDRRGLVRKGGAAGGGSEKMKKTESDGNARNAIGGDQKRADQKKLRINNITDV